MYQPDKAQMPRLVANILQAQMPRAAVAGRKTIACPPARVRSLAQEACGAEDLTGHGPFGSVSGDVSLLLLVR